MITCKSVPNHFLMTCLLAYEIGMPVSCHFMIVAYTYSGTLIYTTCQFICQMAKSCFTGQNYLCMERFLHLLIQHRIKCPWFHSVLNHMNCKADVRPMELQHLGVQKQIPNPLPYTSSRKPWHFFPQNFGSDLKGCSSKHVGLQCSF